MVVIIPNPIVTCGNDAGNALTLTNVRRIMWEPRPAEYQPQLVMNTTPPVDWHKPHKWIRGELHVLSEAYDAFFNNHGVAYIVPGGNNVAFPYFIATLLDVNGKTWTYAFTGLIPVDYMGQFEVMREVIHVYPFNAKYVTPSHT